MTARGPRLRAGAAVADITPADAQFLFGYPHVARYGTGVHDPLLSSALCLCDGATTLLSIANDVIFISKAIAARVRRRLARQTSIPEANILVSATHTHSGPITVDCISNEADAAVPKADAKYVAGMEDRIVEVGVRAWESLEPSELGLAVAVAEEVGTNRRDPHGPADPHAPALVVRSEAGRRFLACVVVYSMHPTVLHEDSTLVSADFPGMTRRYLQQEVLGATCPVIYHTGPAGNQSPRHVTVANTFTETERLGRLLGAAVASVIPTISYRSDVRLASRQCFVNLPRKAFPTVREAEARFASAVAHWERLKREGAPHAIIRTAQCDTFGAEETVTLARAAADGRLDAAYRSCLPAEIQVFQVGPWSFVGWPGEVFVEYGLRVKAASPESFVIALANGELQGYIVTDDAAREGGYEAANALFGPEAGHRMVEATVRQLRALRDEVR